MLTPRKQDTIHKAWLMRLLTGICDNRLLVNNLYFKGGTCAAMQGFIDRFSVDLDFDIPSGSIELSEIQNELENVFTELGFIIKDKSSKVPQYFVRYPAEENQRNTIKIDVLYPAHKSNLYEKVRLPDIDRILICQDKESMFANKMVAVLDRYQTHQNIAGRDIFDIHSYFLRGFSYSQELIKERTLKSTKDFITELLAFVEKHITQTIIDQDLNLLLPLHAFKKARNNLKQEVIMMLRDELRRISH